MEMCCVDYSGFMNVCVGVLCVYVCMCDSFCVQCANFFSTEIKQSHTDLPQNETSTGQRIKGNPIPEQIPRSCNRGCHLPLSDLILHSKLSFQLCANTYFIAASSLVSMKHYSNMCISSRYVLQI